MNLANLITLGRLLSVPAAVWLILVDQMLGAFVLFVLAGVSDAVDGFIAKNFGQKTQLGALLDPIADKALLVSVYVTLGIAGHLPTWLVILVVFRDVLIVGGYLLLMMIAEAPSWQPLMISKINTGLQIALVAVLLAWLGLGLGGVAVVTTLIWAVAATTVLSGAAYLVRWGRALAGIEEAQ
ncbi:MAG TPA: CDP-alcohol phosphatidyltransferase family protein [Candidatus Limnocylindria bacterium]|nr:CDP-alcohol phosphatidyltransferase family protein [Candidatus Limnocylindria bacterium]